MADIDEVSLAPGSSRSRKAWFSRSRKPWLPHEAFKAVLMATIVLKKGLLLGNPQELFIFSTQVSQEQQQIRRSHESLLGIPKKEATGDVESPWNCNKQARGISRGKPSLVTYPRDPYIKCPKELSKGLQLPCFHAPIKQGLLFIGKIAFFNRTMEDDFQASCRTPIFPQSTRKRGFPQKLASCQGGLMALS